MLTAGNLDHAIHHFMAKLQLFLAEQPDCVALLDKNSDNICVVFRDYLRILHLLQLPNTNIAVPFAYAVDYAQHLLWFAAHSLKYACRQVNIASGLSPAQQWEKLLDSIFSLGKTCLQAKRRAILHLHFGVDPAAFAPCLEHSPGSLQEENNLDLVLQAVGLVLNGCDLKTVLVDKGLGKVLVGLQK